MRYIVHSADCTYDTATHKHSIVLDRRISNPTTFRLVSALYEAPTLASYPLGVYLVSDALGEMIPQKHTVKLKASNHENRHGGIKHRRTLPIGAGTTLRTERTLLRTRN